jgi:hypothetical protein
LTLPAFRNQPHARWKSRDAECKYWEELHT